MLPSNPRRIALDILLENSTTRRTLDAVMGEFSPSMDALSRRDRALANALIYGTLRWQGYLDYLMAPFSNRELSTLKPDILYAMRMAMFQVIFMDRIPVSAAVNTAVEAVGERHHRGAAGFVNAVLRKAATGYKKIKLPDADKAPDEYLAVTSSMPIALVRRWMGRFGFGRTE
ncbi:MAG: 16S rRNA (cytosine(967)-C(5))-methyltransferase RsmB, partial [Desulfamplus sp.]|nr:16S rRNA (cytosine(967)-C(5))-methyltransferase RsmB [Desulfamplus sp.]